MLVHQAIGYSGEVTLTDRKTGLEWQLNEPGKMKWPQAMTYCLTLNLNEKGDWRLPNKRELKSAYRIKRRFPGLVEDLYWSSTTIGKNAGFARIISFFKGNAYQNDKRMTHLVRCVRNTAWLTNRKNTHSVKDTKTNLIWQLWEPGEMKWQEANDYCQQLSLEGKVNWRLPDKSELQSAYKIKQEFPNAANSYYWSSSANIANSNIVWCVYFGKPYIGYYAKSGYAFVRCVRNGGD